MLVAKPDGRKAAPLSNPLPLSFSLSLSRSHTLTHTHSLAHSCAHSHTGVRPPLLVMHSWRSSPNAPSESLGCERNDCMIQQPHFQSQWKKILLFATAQMNLEGIFTKWSKLDRKRQINTLWWHLYVQSRKAKLVERKHRTVVSRGHGRGGGKCCWRVQTCYWKMSQFCRPNVQPGGYG